ncbi:MAG: TetR/AcrR family transcriptional regulator [Nocardioides sp.]|uniref:TetR/AcrR family transcriptional regulator n=1 Tax=Nocardioides sp. TaxID=35761 RepID=UPI0039E4744A
MSRSTPARTGPTRSRTARPTTPADTTRERILRATAQVLAERGYARTRLGEVAERAGLRPPAVYYYFDSRDDLVSEVMRVGQQRVRKHVEEAIASDLGDVASQVAAGIEAHLRIQLELSDFAAAVTRNAGHVPPPVRQALNEQSEAYHDLWRRLLRRAHEEELLLPDLDPSIARMLLIGALNWAVEWWTADRDLDALVQDTQSFMGQALFR